MIVLPIGDDKQKQLGVSMRVGCAFMTVRGEASLAQRERDLAQLQRYITIHLNYVREVLASVRVGGKA